MIKDIQEINFPQKDGKQYATLTNAVATLQDMGDKTITSQVKIDGSITPDFSSDWEVEFKGERYKMPLRKPQGAKENTSLNSTVDLTFQHWAVYELKHKYFFQYTATEANTYIPDKFIVPLRLNLFSFCDYLEKVCMYWWPSGAISVDLNESLPQSTLYGDAVGVDISYSTVWDVLIKMYELYGVRWEIKPRGGDPTLYDVKIGYPTTEVSHIWEYGFMGGLLKFEQQVQDTDIRNIIYGRGGEKNLPHRYFKDVDPQNESFQADPDWIPELANVPFTELRGATFRSYIQGWKTRHYGGASVSSASEAYAPWAWLRGYHDSSFTPVEFVADEYNDTLDGTQVVAGSSIDKYGELEGHLDNNEEIYPSIQDRWVDGGRVDVAVAVEPITSDDVEESVEEEAKQYDYNGNKATENVKPKGNYDITLDGPTITVPEGMVGDVLLVGADAYAIAEHISSMRPGSYRMDLTAEHWELTGHDIELYNSVSGAKQSSSVNVPAGSYHVKAVFHVFMKGTVSGAVCKVTASFAGVKVITSKDRQKWHGQWDIWVRNIWGTTRGNNETPENYAIRVWGNILGDHKGNDAKIVFSDGWLSTSENYEFTIIDVQYDNTKKLGDFTSEWRITLAKSDADLETLGVYVPSTQRQASAGDHFFFTGIDLPHQYVVWAEEALDDYKKDVLRKKKEILPAHVVTLDKVRIHNFGEADALIDSIVPGNTVRIADKRFITNSDNTPAAYETRYLKSVTYTYNEPTETESNMLPDVEVVLSDKYEVSANPVETLQGEVDALSRMVGGASNIEQIVRTVGDKLYLRKDGIADRSMSPTEFASLINSTSFRSGIVGGSGWGFFKDENGRWVLETDRINVRQEMQVNELVINQISARGGMIIESAAALEIIRVEDSGSAYYCYFDQKGGTVGNLFHVDDVAYCSIWDDVNSRLKFYRRRVMSVGNDYVSLTKGYAAVELPDGTKDTGVVGVGIPEVGDVIVHFGNYTDKERQFVKVRDVIGGGYERYIEGLDSVNATGKEYYFVGRMAGQYKNRPRWYIGDEKGYIEWVNGELNILGKLNIRSTVGDTPLDQFLIDTDVLYISHTSQTEAPPLPTVDSTGMITNFNGWTTTAPEWRADRYIWQTTYVRKGAGSAYFSDPTCIQGAKGEPGADGTSVNMTANEVRYSTEHTPTQPADSTFTLTEVPTLSVGQYLWSRTTITYNNGQKTTSYSVSRIGADGTSITSTSVTYAKTTGTAQPADSAFIYDSIGAAGVRPGEYLWTKTEVTYSDGNSTKSYSVGRIGADGAEGTPGAPGEDGRTPYTHWAYANSADGTKDFSTTYFEDALYIGICTDYTQQDPTTPSSYEWARMRGQDGDSAKLVIVNADNTVFSYNDNFKTLVGPSRITLSATTQNVSGYQWSYKPQGSDSFNNIGGETGKTLTISPTNTTYFPSSARSCVFRCTSEGVYDEVTIAKVSSGSDGYTVLLTNESHVFKGDTTKAIPDSTSCGIIAYKGGTRVAATIGAITGMPTGMSVEISNNGTTTAEFLVRVTAALTKAVALQGVLNVPITVDGETFNRQFSWTLSLDGVGITTTTEFYAVSNDSVNAPADNKFSTTVPQTSTAEPYLWNYEKTTYSDNTFKSTNKRVIGVHGANGVDGAGISKIENYYLASANASGVTTTTPGWTTNASSAAATVTKDKPFLWNYEKVTYTKGNPTTTTPHVVGRYGADGVGITAIVEEYYLSTSRDTPTGSSVGWTDEAHKEQWVAGRYWWTRSHIFYSDGTDEYVGLRCVTGNDGPAGVSVSLLDLDNEMVQIACNAYGTPLSGQLPVTSTARVYRGSAIDTGWAFSKVDTNCSSTITSAGLLSVSAISANKATVKVTARKSGYADLVATMTLAKVIPGTNGTNGTNGVNAVTFQIQPSVNVITRSISGELSAQSITVTKYQTTGSSPRATTTEKFLYRRLVGVENTPVYVGSTAASFTLSNLSSLLSAKVTAIEFSLYNTNTSSGVLLDRETVPVLTDARGLGTAQRNIALNSGGWNRPNGEFYLWEGDFPNWGFINGGCVTRIENGKLVMYKDVENNGDARNGLYEDLAITHFPAGTVLTLRIKGRLELPGGYLRLVLFRTTDWNAYEFGRITSSRDLDDTFTITVPEDWPQSIIGFSVQHAGVGTKLTLESVGLYNGTIIPSQWEAAPEDKDYLFLALRQAQKEGTSIENGLILSTLIKLGYTDAATGLFKVMSGMSGYVQNASGASDPAIWMGGDPSDSNNQPQSMLYHSGTGYFAGGVFQVLKERIEVLDLAKRIQGDQSKVILDKTGLHLMDSQGHEVLRVANVSIGNTPQSGLTITAQSEVNWVQYLYNPNAGVYGLEAYGSKWNKTLTFASSSGMIRADNATVKITIQFDIVAQQTFPSNLNPLYEWEFKINYASGKVETMTASDSRPPIENGTNTSKYTFTLSPEKGECLNSISIVNTRNNAVNYQGTLLDARADIYATAEISYSYPDCVVVGNNGLMASQGSAVLMCTKQAGASDGETELGAGTYGIKITSTGFKYKSGGSDWKSWNPGT